MGIVARGTQAAARKGAVVAHAGQHICRILSLRMTAATPVCGVVTSQLRGSCKAKRGVRAGVLQYAEALAAAAQLQSYMQDAVAAHAAQHICRTLSQRMHSSCTCVDCCGEPAVGPSLLVTASAPAMLSMFRGGGGGASVESSSAGSGLWCYSQVRQLPAEVYAHDAGAVIAGRAHARRCCGLCTAPSCAYHLTVNHNSGYAIGPWGCWGRGARGCLMQQRHSEGWVPSFKLPTYHCPDRYPCPSCKLLVGTLVLISGPWLQGQVVRKRHQLRDIPQTGSIHVLSWPQSMYKMHGLWQRAPNHRAAGYTVGMPTWVLSVCYWLPGIPSSKAGV
jgi:hypothetical protein